MTTEAIIEARGEARGRAEALLEQMTVKFGPLPAAAVQHVRSADQAQVRAWSTRILTATTLDDMLA
ncbi:hypothetical protein [Nocardia sp. BMG51109]|uniref:hypothetical protein n=1 Tax=Nocardia sp. BMG51109 TaxID=1056816 RepID=UPI0004633B54|nr:hypothetical protein [Nocardia sp. BMG51109]